MRSRHRRFVPARHKADAVVHVIQDCTCPAVNDSTLNKRRQEQRKLRSRHRRFVPARDKVDSIIRETQVRVHSASPCESSALVTYQVHQLIKQDCVRMCVCVCVYVCVCVCVCVCSARPPIRSTSLLSKTKQSDIN